MISQQQIKQGSVVNPTIFLNPERKSARAEYFANQLQTRIVGQERAVRQVSNVYQTFLAGMNPLHRPVGTMLFLGPTGSGKTHVVEAAAEVLFGNANNIVKIDCAEFQHSHEIAKLIGSPPGYLGHRETPPLLTQESLNKSHTDLQKLSIVLFDEIEKASDSLWQLLLGILDKATLTLGDNRRVDFSQTVVIMTSNLGAREMSELTIGGMGFTAGKGSKIDHDEDLDQKIYRTALEAARRRFSPEFMNRIDKTVVFRSLSEEHLSQILELELSAVQERVMSASETKFVFECSATAKNVLLRDGFDARYGARHLKRSLERLLVSPLSNLVASKQIELGDLIYVDIDNETEKFTFARHPGGALIPDAVFAAEAREDLNDGIGMAASAIKAANTFSN